ncbi:MAG TPA: hypothetical protein VGA09_07160 [Candidatus Binatia bacterium]
MADQGCALEREGVHEHHNETAPVCDGVVAWIIGQTETRLIVGDDPKPGTG